MGNCAGERGHQYEESEIQKYKSLVHEKQFQLLRLIYDDLAQRVKQRALSIDNFLLFFHKNGEWGDRLFKQFDTDSSKYISEEQFIKGIVRIFKTTEEQKIQLLFKFFSGEASKKCEGISFKDFLTMLYNYPKEDIKKILNDEDFVNKQLRNHLRAIDNNKFRGRRLMSFHPSDTKNKQINGMKFKIDESDSNSAGSERIESKIGHEIIKLMNKEASVNGKETSFKIRVGENDVEVKTASIHHLVKKMAKGIFRQYKIDEKKGKLKFEYFSDWIKKHKNLYDDYFKSFHNEIWQFDYEAQIPMYLNKEVEMSSKARFQIKDKLKKVTLSLINNVIIVSEQEKEIPFLIICMEGLIAKPIFQESNGYGIEIGHRDGHYETKKFFVINQSLMEKWMDQYLKYFKGASISELYEIKEKIGTGKFSVVYKAKEKSTKEFYALKVIESFKLDEESRNLIAHESTIMQIFQHPLLVRFKETIKTKNHIYILTQLVNGKDLYEFVKDLKYLCEPEAAYIIQQLIVGVRYLHSLGLVHRDLKPENIMIQYNEHKKQIGKIKIIDFGFANHLSKLKTFTGDQLLAGTPNYIAPEILLSKDFNQKIDNFAIGSILYYALSGNPPFNSHDLGQILEKTMEGAFVLNDKRWKNVSEEAKDLVQKLLECEMQNRLSLDDAMNHPWFKKFHCVGGAAYSIKETEKIASGSK